MRHLHRLPLLFLPVNLALAGILAFNETTGLPACAYDCKFLWAAQFNCSGFMGSNEVVCFCGQVGWAQGGSSGSGSGRSGSGWGGCDSNCGESEGGRVRVREWLGRVCDGVGGVGGGGGNGNGNNTGGTGGGPANGNGRNTTDVDGPTQNAADQATRARAWWKKNYPFFVLAFLVVTVPIVLYAFAVPIRKWAKRQLIQNRPRQQGNMEELGSGGAGAGGFVFPRSPGAPAAGSGGSFMGGAAGGGGGGGAGSRHGSSTHALDGPSSSGVFATEVLPPPQQPPPRDAQASTRQESWERRVRAQFSRGNGFRLKFWKKPKGVGQEG